MSPSCSLMLDSLVTENILAVLLVLPSIASQLALATRQ